MVCTGRPIIFFLVARFMSLNSADAGFSIFAAIEIFALFRTGSDASAIRSDTEMLILVGGGAVLTRSVLRPDLAADRLPDFAATADFTFGFLAKVVGFGCIGGLTAIWSKQPCEGHSCKLACDGESKPQPIKIPASMPMKSSPTQFPSSGAGFRSRFLLR